MIEYLQLLRNIGLFENVDSGAQLPLSKQTLIYAENGRGKTTLAAIFRSLGNGDRIPVEERHRLGAAHPPYVVITGDSGNTAIFQNGSWTNTPYGITIFDDHFVEDNVCSGLKVTTEHRQNLHEFIIGAQGVSLNNTLQTHVTRIEEHNRTLQAKANAIPIEIRGGLSVGDFCALNNREDIDQVIQETERSIAATRSTAAIRQQSNFDPLILPQFDLSTIEEILKRDLPELEAAAGERVQTHLASIGDGGEEWVSEGMKRIEAASSGHDHEVCPFCAQDLRSSSLITHYQAYFSAEYGDLKRSIAEAIQSLHVTHGGEVMAAFERSVRVAIERQQFWGKFTEVPVISLDTAAIARAWKKSVETIFGILQLKQSSPLERQELSDEIKTEVSKYNEFRDMVATLSDALQLINKQIAIVKETAAAADLTALELDLKRHNAIKARFRPEIVVCCDDYLQEKQAKNITEGLRDSARAALNQYRETVFPSYQIAINIYLERFNAGFRLDSVESTNIRSGSSCTYTVLINQVAVHLSADTGPSFRNTLSSGDRNTLALAFFFASLERDPNLNNKVVVIDDPMTSLDEHRSLTTVQEIRRLNDEVAQLIVMSHSKPFLCSLWEGADTSERTAIKVVRSTTGSTLTEWDVNQDCITEHDRRYSLVHGYIQNSVGIDERAVAEALRPILESFMRVAYPKWFPPGTLLGRFIGLCQQREGGNEEILSREDRIELRAILDYANLFHHDTNPTWQTENINDQELLDFSKRVLAFLHR